MILKSRVVAVTLCPGIFSAWLALRGVVHWGLRNGRVLAPKETLLLDYPEKIRYPRPCGGRHSQLGEAEVCRASGWSLSGNSLKNKHKVVANRCLSGIIIRKKVLILEEHKWE